MHSDGQSMFGYECTRAKDGGEFTVKNLKALVSLSRVLYWNQE